MAARTERRPNDALQNLARTLTDIALAPLLSLFLKVAARLELDFAAQSADRLVSWLIGPKQGAAAAWTACLPHLAEFRPLPRVRRPRLSLSGGDIVDFMKEAGRPLIVLGAAGPGQDLPALAFRARGADAILLAPPARLPRCRAELDRQRKAAGIRPAGRGLSGLLSAHRSLLDKGVVIMVGGGAPEARLAARLALRHRAVVLPSHCTRTGPGFRYTLSLLPPVPGTDGNSQDPAGLAEAIRAAWT